MKPFQPDSFPRNQRSTMQAPSFGSRLTCRLVLSFALVFALGSTLWIWLTRFSLGIGYHVAIAALIGLITILSIVMITRRMVRSISELTSAANRFAQGEYHTPIGVSGSIELETLSQAFELARQRIVRHLESELLIKTELQRALDSHQETLRVRTEFLANTSHELRTPLTTIIGYSEMLLEELSESNDPRREDLRKILASARHLLSLINSILDISCIESGHIKRSVQQIDLTTVLYEVVDAVRPLAEKHQNRIKIDLDENLGTMGTDIVRFRQIFLNVVGNAIKFTEEGVITISATCFEKENRSWYRFVVSDTGIGISADDLQKIYEPFMQVDGSSTRRYGGLGLGLTIAREFVALLGGTLDISSRLGGGTTCTIELPIKLASNYTGNASASAAEVRSLAGGSKNQSRFTTFGAASRLVLVKGA